MSAPAFAYVAVDASGSRRRGVVEAADRHEAFRKLCADGVTPLRVTPRREFSAAFSFRAVKREDIADLTRELAVLVEARIPLARGLADIADQESKPRFAAMVREIAARVESGDTLTNALTPHREVFGDVYIQTIRAAEQSGNLPPVMAHLAEMLDRQIEASQRLRQALTYPVIVLIAVCLAVSVLVVFVVPRFADTFASNGVELPLLTRIVRAVGDTVHRYWYVFAAALTAIALTVRGVLSTTRGRVAAERLALRTPVVRALILANISAHFTRVVALAISSGLDLIQSVEIAGRATGRESFTAECAEMAEKLRRGEKIVDVFRANRTLPSFARRMLSAGKDSAELSRACHVVAKHFDRESAHLAKNFNALISPVLTVVLAVVVLGVALSVFLPMWQMMRANR